MRVVMRFRIDLNTLNRRLDKRPKNEWGGKKTERELIARLYQTKEDIPKSGIIIDATALIENVVDEILHQIDYIFKRGHDTINRKISIIQFGDTSLEYSIIGEGSPILLFHGGHSSCLEEFGYQRLLDSGYSIITPSRAGYGRTTAIADLGHACTIYNSLLDHLNLEKVHVIAVSAGGSTGILFCSMFADRISSFTLQCAVTKPWLTSEHKEYKMAMQLFNPRTEKRTWKILSTMNNLLPKLTFRFMASSFSSLPYSEVLKELDDDSIETFRKMNNRQRSYSGFLIDLDQTQRDYSKELQSIQARTLIMHSKNDNSVPLSHPKHAKALIPRAEECILNSWGHLIWIGKHAAEYDDALVTYLSKQ